jgi:hypothetical protein
MGHVCALMGCIYALVGCSEVLVDPLGWPCGLRPEVGIVVRPVRCSEEVPTGGEGGIGDLWLASPWLRAVVRGGGGARSRPGVGAGTLVDLAPWGEPDTLIEAIPSVDGGWFQAPRVNWDEAGVRVTGQTIPVPGWDPPTSTGEHAIRWSLDPDGPYVRVHGVDHLWIHARGSHEFRDSRLQIGATVIIADAFDDRVDGLWATATSGLLVARAEDASHLEYPNGPRAQGIALGATGLSVWEGDLRLRTYPIRQGAFDVRVPPTTTHVQATRSGFVPSVRQEPGVDLALALGPSGFVHIEPSWVGRPIPFDVYVSGPNGDVRLRLPSAGGEVPTGPGLVTVRLQEQSYPVPIPPNGSTRLAPTLSGPDNDRAIARLDVPSERDPRYRGSDRGSLLLAGTRGVEFAVMDAPFDIASGPSNLEGPPRWVSGLTAWTSEGHEVRSWPWTLHRRLTGGGAPVLARQPIERALALLSAQDRSVQVPLAALDGLGSPWAVWPRPSHVRLPPVDADPVLEWEPWFRWLDAGIPVHPTGEIMHLQLRGAGSPTRTDALAALVEGSYVGGDGPDLWWTLNGAQPGGVLPNDAFEPQISFDLPSPRDYAIVDVIVDGVLFQRWASDEVPPHSEPLPAGRWATVVGWTPGGGSWATTPAIWLNDVPGQGDPGQENR